MRGLPLGSTLPASVSMRETMEKRLRLRFWLLPSVVCYSGRHYGHVSESFHEHIGQDILDAFVSQIVEETVEVVQIVRGW